MRLNNMNIIKFHFHFRKVCCEEASLEQQQLKKSTVGVESETCANRRMSILKFKVPNSRLLNS
jgi:hypothetical protein